MNDTTRPPRTPEDVHAAMLGHPSTLGAPGCICDIIARREADPAAPDSRHEYVFECGNCREEITAFVPCIRAAAPDAGLREKIAIILGCEIAASSQSCDHKMLADRILAALKAAALAPDIHVKHDDWWCECGSRIEDCDYLQEKLRATPAGPAVEGNQDAGGIPRGPWDVIRDVIRYCQTCGKTRFVEWPHRNCPPDADR